jgi:hypothetical protein
MTRKTSEPSPDVAGGPAGDPLAEWLRMENQLLDQFVAFQTASLASWWALQGEWMRAFGGMAGELPAWMVWHNGTEQLA